MDCFNSDLFEDMEVADDESDCDLPAAGESQTPREMAIDDCDRRADYRFTSSPFTVDWKDVHRNPQPPRESNLYARSVRIFDYSKGRFDFPLSDSNRSTALTSSDMPATSKGVQIRKYVTRKTERLDNRSQAPPPPPGSNLGSYRDGTTLENQTPKIDDVREKTPPDGND